MLIEEGCCMSNSKKGTIIRVVSNYINCTRSLHPEKTTTTTNISYIRREYAASEMRSEIKNKNSTIRGVVAVYFGRTIPLYVLSTDENILLFIKMTNHRVEYYLVAFDRFFFLPNTMMTSPPSLQPHNLILFRTYARS